MTARPETLRRLRVPPRAGLATVATLVLLTGSAAPAIAEHLTLDPGARSPLTRPFDADVNVRVDDDGFHVGGRLLALGQSLGVWLRGRVRDRGITLDGQLQGDKTFNFRLDADTDGRHPRLRIETYPGTL